MSPCANSEFDIFGELVEQGCSAVSQKCQLNEKLKEKRANSLLEGHMRHAIRVRADVL